MPSLITPDQYPLGRTGLASEIGGPADNIADFSFQTPFGLGEFHDTYQGPGNARAQGNGQGVLGNLRTMSRQNGLGVLDRALGRLGF